MATDAHDADVLIAGAGVAGLACGAALADAGFKVWVLERDALPGGRAASWPDLVTGDVVDIGPHVVLSEYRNFRALLRRLGTQEQVHWQQQPLITLLDAGRRLPVRNSRLPPPLHGLKALPAALRCMGVRDLLSNLNVAWHAARLTEEATLALDGMDALRWLRLLGVSERSIEWFWTSATMALLNVPLQHCSAAALMRVYRVMQGRSGYCFGFPKVPLAALYAPGCRARIEAAGGRVLLRTPVARVHVQDRRFRALELEDGSLLRAPAAVLALPPQALRDDFLTAPWPAASHAAHLFEPSPYVSTYLWLDRPVTRARFWARAWATRDLNTDFYVLSNIRPHTHGTLIAANAIHVRLARDWSDEQLIQRTLQEVADFSPLAGQAKLLHARVHRIPMAVPCPMPGTERARLPAETPFKGLWLAGDWTRTALPCSMESAARSAALAAEAVAGELGRPLQLALPVPDTTGVMALLRRLPPGHVVPA
ncbi:hydroxysqualene dehydroxylase [Azohydromonas lata]|uniref:FAD-dependent oxidoreductase n=1 Tax=Azohydromonas lata TaxID=45677 RepID=A0ABU5IHF1_9BURK|nr:FAD-dependent oxidoreductase [Azohydromonas lata]MDZ5458582.1 FAD-dependent oxidoreductase [Azohydromonas lata]